VRTLAVLLGLAIAVLCGASFVAPGVLLGIAHQLASSTGLLVAAAIRIGVGLLLLGVAERSRSPTGLRVLGGITLVAGLVTPLIGADRAQAFVEWWSHRGLLALRLWAALGVALGLYIAWAATPTDLTARASPRAR
jgi:hypothetical protein